MQASVHVFAYSNAENENIIRHGQQTSNRIIIWGKVSQAQWCNGTYRVIIRKAWSYITFNQKHTILYVRPLACRSSDTQNRTMQLFIRIMYGKHTFIKHIDILNLHDRLINRSFSPIHTISNNYGYRIYSLTIQLHKPQWLQSRNKRWQYQHKIDWKKNNDRIIYNFWLISRRLHWKSHSNLIHIFQIS